MNFKIIKYDRSYRRSSGSIQQSVPASEGPGQCTLPARLAQAVLWRKGSLNTSNSKSVKVYISDFWFSGEHERGPYSYNMFSPGDIKNGLIQSFLAMDRDMCEGTMYLIHTIHYTHVRR